MFYVQTSSSISPPHTPSSSKKEKIQEKNNFYLHSSPPLPHANKENAIHPSILYPYSRTTNNQTCISCSNTHFYSHFSARAPSSFFLSSSYFPEQLSLDCCFVSFRIASVVLFFCVVIFSTFPLYLAVSFLFIYTPFCIAVERCLVGLFFTLFFTSFSVRLCSTM